MGNPDFSNKDEITAWLRSFPTENRHWLVNRACLRVFACVCLFHREDRDAVILNCARVQLANGYLATKPAKALPLDLEDIEWSAECAVDNGAPMTPGGSPADPAGYGAAICSADPDIAMMAISWAIEAAELSDASEGGDLAASVILADAEAIDKPDRQRALWPDGACPEGVRVLHARLLKHLAGKRRWAFWHRWYGGMWDGSFADWELAREVVLIKEKSWQKGTAAVAKGIRKLEES